MKPIKPNLIRDSISTKTANEIDIDGPPIRVEVRCKNLGASLWLFCQHLEEVGADYKIYAFLDGEWRQVQLRQAVVSDEHH